MTTAGVFDKYQVLERDGTPIDQEARYFILRTDTDRHAKAALKAYAQSVRNEKGIAALRTKYEVRKRDGSTIAPGARYFVLRLDRDQDRHARRAIRAYARSVLEENRELGQDLARWLWNFAPGPNCGCREAGCAHWGPEFSDNSKLMNDVGARF